MRDLALFLFMLDTGVRASELVAINVDDLNREAQSVLLRHTKARRQRTCYMSPKTAKAVRKYLSKRRCARSMDPLFAGQKGRLTPSAVIQLYRSTQPEAVRCLRTDFRTTIAYFAVHERHPTWKLSHVRTTSRLERFNRTLRRRTRAAAAYHSEASLCTMLTHEVNAFNLGKPHQ